jgi:hypothetical protein
MQFERGEGCARVRVLSARLAEAVPRFTSRTP